MKKRDKIIYWISTLWLALGMLSTGAVQLLKAKEGQGGVDMITHLGYPVYLLTLLGAWKILGVVTLLIPKFPLLKEWAYAGIAFAWIMALISARASGEPVLIWMLPLMLLTLLVVSYATRPPSRRLTPHAQSA